MSKKLFECPKCKVQIIYEKDDVDSHPHCPSCSKNWCPNIDLKWHGQIELEIVVNSRGKYYRCPVCRWYSGIEKESRESVITQSVFITTLISHIKNFTNVISVNDISFRSTLAGEEPWYTLGERLEKYGKIKTSDLELVYRNEPVTKFELKGWKNYDAKLFYFTKRAHVNVDEVKDAAKVDGYVCFITLKDNAIICTRASDIIKEWEKFKVRISMTTEERVKEATLDHFRRGVLVVIAPDKQGNYRFVLSKEYKKKYCKYLKDYIPEIVDKIIRNLNE